MALEKVIDLLYNLGEKKEERIESIGGWAAGHEKTTRNITKFWHPL